MEIIEEQTMGTEEKIKLKRFFRRLQKCPDEKDRDEKVYNFTKTEPNIAEKVGEECLKRLVSGRN